MKLNVKEDPAATEVVVTVVCPRVDARVQRIMAAVEMEDMRLAGIIDGFLCILEAREVLYVETVDEHTFLYGAKKVYESTATLAEIESHLAGEEFVRASRQTLVNLAHVRGIKPYLNARLELVLDNDERIIASRQFAPLIKKRIGL